MNFLSSADIFQHFFSSKYYFENNISVKQLGFRSGPTLTFVEPNPNCCKDHQQKTKFSASRHRAKLNVPFFLDYDTKMALKIGSRSLKPIQVFFTPQCHISFQI